MKSLIQVSILFIILLFNNGCNINNAQSDKELKIAFLSDVHLQNLYGELSDSDFRGVKNPKTGTYVLGRTMESQLHSTRLFNENYFAFLSALDDIVKRDVHLVVLPGDFSDDGQPLNVRGLQEILHKYESEHGLQFIVTTGNHDPSRPFSLDAGKIDYLGEGGKRQAIMSKEGLYEPIEADENPVVITSDIRKLGYQGVLKEMGDFGFYPKEADIYWETPFSTYSYDNYSFEKAQIESNLEKRKYPIPPTNALLPDVSYLEEPIEGLWVLSIDGNVYLPNNIDSVSYNPEDFDGASIGYNQVLTNKKHLIKWIKKVTYEAKKRGKTLIAFSHYPMVEFYDNASPEIRKLLGDDAMDLHRIPTEDVSRVFAEAGLKLHFGGHMHINDTGIRTYDDGKFIVNVQTPSLAAYIPAYKLLTIHSETSMEVQTIILDSVPRFKELFPLYEKEYDYLTETNRDPIWDKEILNVDTYHTYTAWHLKEVLRMRFLNDWPKDLRDFLLKSTGNQMLQSLGLDNENSEFNSLPDMDDWNGFDLLYDLYRLRSADKLAIPDIGKERIEEYSLFFKCIDSINNSSSDTKLLSQMKEFGVIYNRFLNGAPANHFLINLNSSDSILTAVN